MKKKNEDISIILDTAEKKHISEWEVLTPDGFKDFNGIRKIMKDGYYALHIDGDEFICSGNHKIKTKDGFKYASKLKQNDELLEGQIVDSIVRIDEEIDLYDLLNVGEEHEYYTNGIISANCAFAEYAREIWTAAQQAAMEGKIIIISTPAGVGGFFHQMWTEAEAGINDFNTIKLKWDIHPDHDQAWRDEQTVLLGERLAAQEADADFITSGHTVIDGTILQWYKDNTEDPIEKRGFDGNIWIWERPDYHKSYVVCADVARGDGADYSTFHILDIEDVRQVVEYKGKLPPAEFGNMLISMATEYNDALLIIDNTGLGWAAIQPAIDRSYPYLFYMSKDFAYMDIQVQLQKGLDLKQKEDMIPGFTTSTKTRPVIISKLETYFRERTPTVRSTRLVDELFTFIWNNGKAEARTGYNDDLTMAFSIGLWVRDTALQLNQKGLALTKASMDYIGKLNEPQIYSSSPYTDAGKKAWTMNVGKNQTEDLEWLIR